MKIVYIANSIIPSRQANSIHVMNMCSAFAQNGHIVYLIVPNKNDFREPDINDVFAFYGVEQSFQIIYIPCPPFKGGNLITKGLSVFKARKINPDIIYCRDHIAALLASFGESLVTFESHSSIQDNGIISLLIFRKLIQRPTFGNLVVITHSLKGEYLKNYPYRLNNIIVAPDGANPVTTSIDHVKFSDHGETIHCGYVGHLYSGRGLEIIIKMAMGCPWADFQIIGGTDQDINSYQKEVKRIPNIFLHGFKSPKETEQYRISCDVLLAPYQNLVTVAGGGNTVQWMSPLKIFEYMAAGKAIIASDLPVLREVLAHEHNCLLCPPTDVQSWISALERLREDPKLRITLGNNAKRDFLQSYTWKERAKKVLMSEKPAIISGPSFD